DLDFFRARLMSAIALRNDLLSGAAGSGDPRRARHPGQSCRLVFSESDGLSGLIVDQYDCWLVTQITSLAIANRREMFADLLMELLQPEGIYLRTERGI